MHSEFGRILPTQDLDGIRPYLDPLGPIPSEHIHQAAEQAGIRPEDIDAAVAGCRPTWDATSPAARNPKPGLFTISSAFYETSTRAFVRGGKWNCSDLPTRDPVISPPRRASRSTGRPTESIAAA